MNQAKEEQRPRAKNHLGKSPRASLQHSVMERQTPPTLALAWNQGTGYWPGLPSDCQQDCGLESLALAGAPSLAYKVRVTPLPSSLSCGGTQCDNGCVSTL